MTVVDVEHIDKSFKKEGKMFPALRDVSLSIRRGEIFGLLGPNGAGKTTLMNIVIGILTPDRGTVRLFGKPISPESLERVSMVSGETRFHFALYARDILNFYARIYGLSERQREQRIERLVRLFGLDEVRNQKFYTLSTGQKMRLTFAKALINHPSLLILDEPTLGLDPEVAIRVRDEIKRINRKFGTTILLTSHYMNEVEQLADRIAFIHRGEVVDTGTVEKVTLRHFKNYEVIVTVQGVKQAAALRRHGFVVSGRKIKKTVSLDANISAVLADLGTYGMTITNVETRRPTLEDYFVKLARRRL